MDTYHKIQSIFKRDPENNYKTFTDEYSKPIFKYLSDNQWEFTEKVDGTNIRVIFNGENVFFGGRNKNSQIPTHLLTELQKLFSTTKKKEIFKNNFSSGVCLYGEGYGYKIQKAGSNYLKDTHSFVLFDVKIGGWWLKREDVEDVADTLGIEVVPVLGYGTLYDAIKTTRDGFNSSWGDFIAEGLVLRPSVPVFTRKGDRVITKVKHKDFK